MYIALLVIAIISTCCLVFAALVGIVLTYKLTPADIAEDESRKIYKWIEQTAILLVITPLTWLLVLILN